MLVDGETGLLCKVGDTAALGKALASLLQDRSRQQRMGEAAHRRIGERFSLSNMVDSTLAMLSRGACRDSAAT